MSNPARIGQEAPDLKTPSSPSRITPTRALDEEMSKSEPPAPKYPYAVDDDGVARVGCVAVDPGQHNKATELQLWPLFGSIVPHGVRADSVVAGVRAGVRSPSGGGASRGHRSPLYIVNPIMARVVDPRPHAIAAECYKY